MNIFRGKGLGRQKAREPISARFLSGVAEAAEGQAVPATGLASTSIDGRELLRVVPRDAKWVLTPGGGIAAATYSGGTLTCGSATCTLLDPDGPGKWVLGNGSVTVYNGMTGTSGAIAGSTVVQCKLIDGSLVVDVSGC